MDEIDAHVALLKDEINKRKEQIENSQVLEGELEKLNEEAKRRCERIQNKIIHPEPTQLPPSSIVAPLHIPSSSSSISPTLAAHQLHQQHSPPLVRHASPPSASTAQPMATMMNTSRSSSGNNIIRPLAHSEYSNQQQMRQQQQQMEPMMPPSYSNNNPNDMIVDSPPPFTSTMPHPVRMAPDYGQFHHHHHHHQQQPAGSPPTLRQQQQQQQQHTPPSCNRCTHTAYHHSHQQLVQHSRSPASQPPPPGFPAGNYDDFTNRSSQLPPTFHHHHQLQGVPAASGVGQTGGPSQRLAGSHAEIGGFQDFASASRNVVCPHCNVHGGAQTSHLLHHHPAGDFNNHHPSPPNRSVVAGLSQQPIGQLIGRTTADGGRGDPSQGSCKRRIYPYPVKRILLTRDPRDKSVRSNGLGMRVVGGKQVPGAPEGELGAFVVQVFQGGVADQLHGEVKEGDQVMEWNGIGLSGRTFEDCLQIINQPCEEIEIVIKPSEYLPQPQTTAPSAHNRPQSQHSLYDNHDNNAYDQPANSSSTEMFGDSGGGGAGGGGGRRGYYESNRQRLPHSGSGGGGSGGGRGPRGIGAGHTSMSRPESSSSVEFHQQSSFQKTQSQQELELGSGGEIQIVASYDDYERVLNVEVVRARNLGIQMGEENEIPNPYVRLRLNPVKDQACVQTSSQLYSTANPEFHQQFCFALNQPGGLQRRSLDICVWDMVDADRKRERLIGETVVNFASAASIVDGRPHWLRLSSPPMSFDHQLPAAGGPVDQQMASSMMSSSAMAMTSTTTATTATRQRHISQSQHQQSATSSHNRSVYCKLCFV